MAIWRRLGPEGRAATAFRMIRFSRQAALQAIRGRHPEYDERASRLALMRLLYGDELVATAWPGEPLRDP